MRVDKRREGFCSDVADIEMVVVPIERFETFPLQGLVDGFKRQ
jgi:hypothetical protein